MLWRRTDLWPFITPGFKLLPDAAQEIARAAWPDDWAGDEFTHKRTLLSVPHPDKAFDEAGDLYEDMWENHGREVLALIEQRGEGRGRRPTRAQWQLAYEMFRKDFIEGAEIDAARMMAIEQIHEMLAAGDLVAHARNDATGQMVRLEAHHWNCGRDLAHMRFSRCRINLDRSMDARPSDQAAWSAWLGAMNAWLFVGLDDLENTLRSVRLRTNSAPPSHQIETTNGLGGRPNIKHAYMAELERRISAGEIAAKLEDEARYLCEWCGHNYPEKPFPRLPSMRNAIRPRFNQHRASIGPKQVNA